MELLIRRNIIDNIKIKKEVINVVNENRGMPDESKNKMAKR